jgi:hypothetical protein
MVGMLGMLGMLLQLTPLRWGGGGGCKVYCLFGMSEPFFGSKRFDNPINERLIYDDHHHQIMMMRRVHGVAPCCVTPALPPRLQVRIINSSGCSRCSA